MERVWSKWYEFPRQYTGHYIVRTRDIMDGNSYRERMEVRLMPEVTDWIQAQGCWANIQTSTSYRGIKIRADDEALLTLCILTWGLTVYDA